VLAARKERPVLLIQLAGLVANVALNVVLIPLFGPSGAAVSLLASDFIVIAWMTVLVHRHLFRVPVARLLLKPTGAGVVAIPLAALVATRNALGGALIGVAASVAVLLLLQYVTLEEWRPVRAVFRAPFEALRRRRIQP
jgi:O-antigen/teichoic acid export membrane protein